MPISAVDRKILNCIQKDLPLEANPFRVLSKRVGLSQEQLLKRIKQLKAQGYIRGFSCHLNHRKFNFKSTLIALRVGQEKIEAVTKKIIVAPEATHCFLRKDNYNIWVAFIYKDGRLRKFLDGLSRELGRENILNFPTEKQFKLSTVLKI